MRLSPADHEVLIGNALAYYGAHKESVSIRKVILLFGVNKTTFLNRLRNKTRPITTIGGQNKLLTDVEQSTVITYCHRQAYAGFPCTWQMILAAVTHIQSLKGMGSPSKAWAKFFLSKHGPILKADFHKIKWKPMDRKRRAAQEPGVIIQFFRDLAYIRKTHDIRPENMWNFDESGFRNACPLGVWVWVPI